MIRSDADMSRTVLITILLLVAGAGLYLLAADGGAEGDRAEASGGGSLVPDAPLTGPAAGGSEPEGSGAAARTVLETPVRTDGAGVEAPAGTTVVFPLEVELSLVSRAAVPRPEDKMPFRAGAVAGIEGTLTGRSGEPLAGAVVTFIAGPNTGRELVADVRGRFGATDLWEGLSIVRIRGAGHTSERPVLLGRLGRTPFSVDFGGGSFVAATVQDAAGQPLQGVEVRLDGSVMETDPSGIATFSNVSAGKVMLSARKEGFAMLERELSLSRNSTVDAADNVLTLRPGATLEVQLASSSGLPGTTKLYVFPAGGPGGPGGTTLRDFPWHALHGIEVTAGKSTVLTGLPEDTVTLRWYHPGARAEPSSVNVRLHAGQATRQEIRLAAAPALLRGKVFREGRPEANARVTLEAPDRDFVTTSSLDKKPTFAMEMVLGHLPVAFEETKTDGTGSFTFTAYPGFDNGRYVIAESADGTMRAAQVVSSTQSELRLELREVPREGGDLVVDLPGRFQALPVEVRVQGAPRDPFLLRPGEPLAITDLEPGTWRVYAVFEGEDVVPRRIVEIGEETARVEGTLPEGALQGQPEDVRRRVGALR